MARSLDGGQRPCTVPTHQRFQGKGHPLRILLRHQSLYRYAAPAALGPHQVRLRPASHARARVEHYALHLPEAAAVRWQQDPFGNHVAHLSFKKGTRLPELEVLVELAVDIRPVNPFDFFLDDRCEQVPFAYPEELRRDLSPFLDLTDPSFATGPGLARLLAALPPGGQTVTFVSAVNAAKAAKGTLLASSAAGGSGATSSM